MRVLSLLRGDRGERLAAVGVVAALGAYYFATACREVQGADSGEFATLFAEGGVAHPPGYPLYVLYLRVMRWMPGATPALAAARATALLGIPAMALVYAACRAWGASRRASVVATALLGASRVACEQFTQAEAFALGLVVSAAMLAACGPRSALRGGRRLLAIGALTGLGAAHHHTLATLAPVALLAAVTALRSEGARLRDAGLTVVAFCAGTSAYLYPLFVARHPHGEWIWGMPSDARGLANLFLRADYWQRVVTPRYPWEYTAALGHGLVEAYWGVGLVLVAAGLARWVAHASIGGTPSRGPALALVASGWLAGPGILSTFPGFPSGVRLAIAERFFLLPALIAALPFGVGLDALLRAHWTGRWTRQWLPPASLAAVVLAHALWTEPRLDEDRRPTGARLIRNVLRALPPRAVVVGSGDLYCFGFLYAQHALHLREDVTYVDAGMLALPWYRATIARSLEDPPDAVEGTGTDAGAPVDVVPLVDRLLASSRPVFLAVPPLDLPARLRTVGYAGVLRVLPPGQPAPGARVLERENLEAMRDFEWDATPVRDRWSWAGFAEGGYRATWQSVADADRAEGLPVDAARNMGRAARGSLGP